MPKGRGRKPHVRGLKSIDLQTHREDWKESLICFVILRRIALVTLQESYRWGQLLEYAVPIRGLQK